MTTGFAISAAKVAINMGGDKMLAIGTDRRHKESFEYISKAKVISFLERERLAEAKTGNLERAHFAGEMVDRLNKLIEREADTYDTLLPAITDPVIVYSAIARYGENAQVDVCIEEMAELTKALLKRRRGGDFGKIRENIIDEIADALICIKQLTMLYLCHGEVQNRIEYKLERLKNRMEEEDKR